MKKCKKILILVALVTIMLGMSVAFAAPNQSFKVNEENNNLNIKFENFENIETTGNAQEIKPAKINSSKTEIEDYEVILTAPGDSITYSFDIVNNGKIDVEITNLNNNIKYVGDEKDIEIVKSGISYTVQYENGEYLMQGDTLTVGSSKTVILKLAYDSNIQPHGPVSLENLGIDITYTQLIK